MSEINGCWITCDECANVYCTKRRGKVGVIKINEAKQSLNDYLSKPLVDQKTAGDLKRNCESLLNVGVKPDIDALRYIKLAEYEQEDERTVALGVKLTLDGAKTMKMIIERALDEYEYKGRTFREWADIISGMEGDNNEANM